MQINCAGVGDDVLRERFGMPMNDNSCHWGENCDKNCSLHLSTCPQKKQLLTAYILKVAEFFSLYLNDASKAKRWEMGPSVLFVNCWAYTTKRFDDNIETSIQYK